MKKIILIFLTFILALSCIACDGGGASEGDGTNEANNTLTGKVDLARERVICFVCAVTLGRPSAIAGNT